MKLVPELICTDFETTKAFYVYVFGFKVKYERIDERFAYFTLDGVDLMCEELAGPGRRWLTGDMEPPFGRGINLQWEVRDVQALYERIRTIQPEAIYMEIEEQSYVCGDKTVKQTQFIAQDPDGYLFRFCN